MTNKTLAEDPPAMILNMFFSNYKAWGPIIRKMYELFSMTQLDPEEEVKGKILGHEFL